jgi:biopolymer transport protein ExbD
MERRTGEINAGSMADIAFLLLIFFLVATTMEVDAGINRNLPLKKEYENPPPPVPKRCILEINVNSNDELMVEDQFIKMNELADVCLSFYQANSSGVEADITMPPYNMVDENQCIEKIMEQQSIIKKNPYDKTAKSELERWQTRRSICELSGGAYQEISKMTLIRIENQANTRYGTYIGIQNILKKVINELRQARCTEFGWENYFSLKDDTADGREKIQMLRILVPERIIEAKIEH